jgi:hypothetical protein
LTALITATLITLALATAAHARKRPAEHGVWNPPRISQAREAVVQRLDRGLAGTPMQKTGRELEAAGWKHRISPYFIAAIAGTESSFGAAACSGNPRNAFGLSSCTSGWTVPYFRTWAQAYTFMAVFLTSRWPHARTTMNYHGYAACSSCWGAKTGWWMLKRFNTGPDVRYP